MDRERIKVLLGQVEDKSITVTSALEKFTSFPYDDLDFAKIDTHRMLRTGFPEVIFCPGKTIEQIAQISKRLIDSQQPVMATRATNEIFEAISNIDNRALYYDKARIVAVGKIKNKKPNKKILVISAGTADMPVAEEAAVTAELLGGNVERFYDVGTAGLHRLTGDIQKLNSADVIIVVAGMEGALASVVGGLTGKPIIAVPTSVGYGSNFEGLAALLTMLNTCAPGVAVMNIDNGFGAGHFASLLN